VRIAITAPVAAHRLPAATPVIPRIARDWPPCRARGAVRQRWARRSAPIAVRARRLDKAAAVAWYGRLRRNDQIVDGTLRYEIPRRRSLDFTSQSVASWVNIAKMAEKLKLDLWSDGLGSGHSVKARRRQSAPLPLPPL
jgi:hypothetical protein